MMRYVRYSKKQGGTIIGPGHREEWVDNEGFRKLVDKEMKGEIKKLVVIKKEKDNEI